MGRALGSAMLGLGALALCLVAAGGAARAEDEPYVFEVEKAPRELTQITSEAEIGYRYGSEDSYKFGDFTGLQDKGPYLHGNMDIGQRSPYDAEVAHYWRLKGTNLGLSSRELRAEYARQGLFAIGLDWRELPKLRLDSGQTFFRGVGDDFLSLPAGWVGEDFSEDMGRLDKKLRDLNVRHDREKLGVDFSLTPWGSLGLDVRYDHETKKGTKIVAAVMGDSGSSSDGKSILVPEPIDYVTDQLDVSLTFGGDTAQGQIGYYLSAFENKVDSLTFENPYTSSRWDAAAEWPNGRGRKGLAPDSVAHQVRASGGVNLPMKTRVTVDAALGWMLQDEDFLPYTVNDLVVSTPLPRDSLEGEIETRYLNARVTSRPIGGLTVKAFYRYDDRDNKTPRDMFIYIGGDSVDQGDKTGGTARINLPFSSTLNEYGVGASYRFCHCFTMGLDYEREEIERTFSEVDKTKEDQLHAKLRLTPIDMVNLSLKGGYADRNGSTYNDNYPYLVSHSSEHTSADSFEERFENHPELRRYYLADRVRYDLGAETTITPMDTVSIDLGWNQKRDRYDDTEVGLKRSKMTVYSADVSWAPMDWISAHGFYSYEDIKSDQNGWQFTGGNTTVNGVTYSRLEQTQQGLFRWSAADRNRIHTVGGGGELHLLDGKLGLGADFAWSKARGQIVPNLEQFLADGADNVNKPNAPFPKVRSTLHTVRAHADYELVENMTLKLGYIFEKMRWEDWGFDGIGDNLPGTPGIGAGDLHNVIPLGEGTPGYRAHVVTLSFVYRFWM
jgi:MtrB/PioB family decaheme-associated outer membrane protein